MKSEEIISKVISYLFHPLLLPSLGLLLLYNQKELSLWMPPSEIKLTLFFITFVATFLLPVLNALFLVRFKIISSLEMKTMQERMFPFIATSFFYVAELYAVTKTDLPGIFQLIILGATVSVVAITLINLLWKISAHMTGIGGLIGMMMVISYRLQVNFHLILILLFLAAGLVGFSRLKLGAHTPDQVYVGFFLGVVIQLVLFL